MRASRRARHRLPALLAALACFSSGACGGERAPANEPRGAAQRALSVADAYVAGYFRQFPEEAYEFGYADAPADRFGDRSPAALEAWAGREDAWLAELRSIDARALDGTEAEIPYRYALDRLEAAVGRRVCRSELWNVSPTWTGWPELFPAVFEQQPVETPEAREAVVARARDVDRYLGQEIANLREGVRTGYTAPRANVDAVVAQVDALLGARAEDSPFLDPAERAADPALREALLAIVREEIRPAARRYRDFLAHEYREVARTAVGVSANPEGAACYRASVRFHTTLPLAPEEIHETGLRRMEAIQAEMRGIARRLFGTDDVREALERARIEPRYTFASEEEILAYARSAIDRARAAVPDWFGFVPEARVVIRPYPAFQKRTGGGFYSAGTAGQPGTYRLGTYEPRKLSKAGLEATTFHETWPGHHLQAYVAIERGGVHPVQKYLYNSGMGEGWALYTERLADEMGLYSGDVDRLGMLSNEALRAARLVVDPGMHTLGWTREHAIEYMRGHTAESDGAIAYEVNRYLAVPGQATAYMTGSVEIRRLREQARARLGDAFDVRAFHDVVLRSGTISLPMLGEEVEAWAEARSDD